MTAYHIQLAPREIVSVVADDIQVDEKAGVRRFLCRGEVVRTVPISARYGYTVVTEVIRSSRNEPPIQYAP